MRRLILFLLFFVMIGAVHAQFTYGTTGLLNMPTADMQRDKTFMFGGGFLEKHVTPARWTYNTFNYYLDISILLPSVHELLRASFAPSTICGVHGFHHPSFHSRKRTAKLRSWLTNFPYVEGTQKPGPYAA